MTAAAAATQVVVAAPIQERKCAEIPQSHLTQTARSVGESALPKQRLAATRWDQLAVIKHEGTLKHVVDGQELELNERSQILPHGVVRLGAGSRALLRAPDGSPSSYWALQQSNS